VFSGTFWASLWGRSWKVERDLGRGSAFNISSLAEVSWRRHWFWVTACLPHPLFSWNFNINHIFKLRLDNGWLINAYH
jgi:hypothetical protein